MYFSRVELHAIWQKPTDALGGGSNLAKLPVIYTSIIIIILKMLP